MQRSAQKKNKPKKMPRDLTKAIKDGDDAKATQILSGQKYQNAEWINSVTRGGKTPLLLAIKYKRTDIARLIMRNPHTDMNATYTDYGYSACVFDRCSDIDFMLELIRDARTNFPQRYLSTLLLRSKEDDADFQLRAIQALINKGIDVNATYGGDATFLWWAAAHNHVEVVRYLLSHPGIDVNKNCPLEQAANHLHTEILHLLLARPEIDVSRKKFLEITATGYLRKYNNPGEKQIAKIASIKALLNHPILARRHLTNPLLKWLLEINPGLYKQIINLPDTKINTRIIKGDWYESSALKHMDVTPTVEGVLSILINSPDFDVNMPLWNGHTLLTWVTENYNSSQLQMLLDCERVNLHQQNQAGYSALTLAKNLGKLEIAEAIMSHPRFNVNASYNGNRNLLMHAAEHDCVDLMRHLLAEGQFPINATDAEGNTALILIANNHKNADDASIFIELLNKGANPAQKNARGTNAIMAAKNNGLKGIAHALKHEAPVIQDSSLAPSAPPYDESAMQAISAAATQPPQLSQHGMFAHNGNLHSNLQSEEVRELKHEGP